MEMQPFTSLINPVLCQLAIMRGVASPVKGEETSEQVTLYTYNSLYHTSTVIESEVNMHTCTLFSQCMQLYYFLNQASVCLPRAPPMNSFYSASNYVLLQKERKVSVQLDCSGSVNFLYNRESCVQVLEVPPKCSVVSRHSYYK